MQLQETGIVFINRFHSLSKILNIYRFICVMKFLFILLILIGITPLTFSQTDSSFNMRLNTAEKKIDNIQMSLILFNTQYQKGRKLVTISPLIFAGGTIFYLSQNVKITSLNQDIQKLNSSRTAELNNNQISYNSGFWTSIQLTEHNFVTNKKFDDEINNKQSKKEKVEKTRMTVLLTSSAITCIGIWIGSAIMANSHNHLKKAGLGFNQSGLVFTF